jgi:hypothetical protein
MVIVAEVPVSYFDKYASQKSAKADESDSWLMLDWVSKSGHLSQKRDDSVIVGFTIWRWRDLKGSQISLRKPTTMEMLQSTLCSFRFRGLRLTLFSFTDQMRVVALQ